MFASTHTPLSPAPIARLLGLVFCMFCERDATQVQSRQLQYSFGTARWHELLPVEDRQTSQLRADMHAYATFMWREPLSTRGAAAFERIELLYIRNSFSF
jgi:hypothetical protein